MLSFKLKDVRDRKILHKGFFNISTLLIQGILSQKSMKKFTVTNEKIFRVYKAFDRKKISHTDLRTFHAQLSKKGCQNREDDYENKILS